MLHARRARPAERDRRQLPARHGRAAARLRERRAGDRAADQRDPVLRRPGVHRARRSQNLTGLDDPVRRPDHVHRRHRDVERGRRRRRCASTGRSTTRTPASSLDGAARTPSRAYTALAFLRTRHGVGDGSDLGRISSQQVFLSSLVRKIKSDDTLTDFGKLYGIAQAATQNITLSDELRQPRHPGVGRAGAQEHPAREHRVRAVPEHDRRHAASTPARCSRSPRSPTRCSPRSRQTSRSGSTPTRSRERTAARPSTRTPRRRRPTPTPIRRPTPTDRARRAVRPCVVPGVKGQTAAQYTCSARPTRARPWPWCRMRLARPAMMAEAYRETSHSPVECTTLLRWRTRKGSEGSNPSVSASKRPDQGLDSLFAQLRKATQN